MGGTGRGDGLDRLRRDLGAMMLKDDSYVGAYRSYVTALDFDPADTAALGGLVRAAVATRRQAEAIERLKASIATRPQLPAIRIALSRLLAASGAVEQAIASAKEACNIKPIDPAALATGCTRGTVLGANLSRGLGWLLRTRFVQDRLRRSVQ